MHKGPQHSSVCCLHILHGRHQGGIATCMGGWRDLPSSASPAGPQQSQTPRLPAARRASPPEVLLGPPSGRPEYQKIGQAPVAT
eukprot:scaffold560388_cov37-Prasinocladus_malaysianus.AAC.3